MDHCACGPVWVVRTEPGRVVVSLDPGDYPLVGLHIEVIFMYQSVEVEGRAMIGSYPRGV